MDRLRVVCVVVTIDAFSDDGDTLTPIPIQPIKVPIAAWSQFIEGGFEAAVAELRMQVEGEE